MHCPLAEIYYRTRNAVGGVKTNGALPNVTSPLLGTESGVDVPRCRKKISDGAFNQAERELAHKAAMRYRGCVAAERPTEQRDSCCDNGPVKHLDIVHTLCQSPPVLPLPNSLTTRATNATTGRQRGDNQAGELWIRLVPPASWRWRLLACVGCFFKTPTKTNGDDHRVARSFSCNSSQQQQPPIILLPHVRAAATRSGHCLRNGQSFSETVNLWVVHPFESTVSEWRVMMMQLWIPSNDTDKV
jgi:hypothetical protein